MKMNMLDRNNEFNCTECSYNIGCDDFQHRLPCGQWNCWVTLNCDRAEGLDDDDDEEGIYFEFQRPLSIREGFIPSFFYVISFKLYDLFIVQSIMKGNGHHERRSK